MKTQTNTNKISKLLFAALASIVLMNVACAKKNSGGHAAPPPVVNPACVTQYCPPGGVVGQALYGGTTTNGLLMNAQFEVSGDPSGYGPGTIVGTVVFSGANGYVCQMSQPNLSGPYTIQMSQQGSLYADVFEGAVMLVGPQGSYPAQIQVVPARPQGTGLFSIAVCGGVNEMNF